MITNYPVLSRVGLIFLETIITILSYVLANYIRNFMGLSSGVEWLYYWNLLFIIIIVWGGLSEYQEAYAGSAFKSGRSLSVFKSLKREITVTLRTVIVGCLIVYFISIIILPIIKYQNAELNVPKSLVVIFGIVNILMLSVEKIILYKYMEYSNKNTKNIKKVLVLGTGDVAKQFLSSIDSRRLKVLGLVSKEEHNEEKEMFGYKIIGRFDSLAKILNSYYIDELIITLPAKDLGDIEEVISTCDKEGIPVRIVSPFFKNLISKSKAEVVNGLPNIVFSPVERNDLEMAIKRMFDLMISSFCLIFLSPLIMAIALIVKITSPGRIFYQWKIMGVNKKHFISYKFRTMAENAEEIEKKLREKKNNEMQGVYFKLKDDFRVTPIGRFLRKYSLDEIPQLYSVVKGDMSLVGPRPVRIMEKEELKNWHKRRFCVKPGVTSPWVVMGKNKISDFDEIAKLDLNYIDNWSLWLDLKILFRTVPVLVFGRNY
ncbi:MAG: sugar transferase [Nitrospirae bacterium]|nr:sugar transferase [Nitrospirota bacterium]